MLLWLASALAAELSGVVIDEQALPVANAYVVVYDSRFQFQFAQTDIDGNWAVSDLPGDRYRLRILPPSASDSVEMWGGGTLGACNAEPYDIADDESRSFGFALMDGARIEGTALLDGEPVQGVRVNARTLRNGQLAQTRFDFTDEDGHFVIRGITPDQDGVGFFAVELSRTGLPTQFVPGVYTAQEGTSYELVGGDHIDLGELELRPGATVSGQVSGPSGLVDGGQAVVFSSGQSNLVPVAGGSYSASGVRPGEALIWAYADGLATSYYPNTADPLQRVTVGGDGDTVEGIDLSLPAEGAVSGQLAGGPFEDTTVIVYNAAQTTAVTGELAEDGSFYAGTLHAGSYLLYVDAVGDGFVEDFVRDPDGSATALTVSAGEALDLGTVVLPEGARLSGTLTDRYTGEPVYGASVVAESQLVEARRSTTTDRDGYYALEGLHADRWSIRAEYQAPCEPDPSFVPTYYPNQRNPTLAQVVQLVGGQDLEWNPALAPDVDRDGMDDEWEREHGLDPTVDDSSEDPDGDGFSNRDEYLLGTDPMDFGPQDTGAPKSCACDGTAGGWWLFGLPLLGLRRRR